MLYNDVWSMTLSRLYLLLLTIHVHECAKIYDPNINYIYHIGKILHDYFNFYQNSKSTPIECTCDKIGFLWYVQSKVNLAQ